MAKKESKIETVVEDAILNLTEVEESTEVEIDEKLMVRFNGNFGEEDEDLKSLFLGIAEKARKFQEISDDSNRTNKARRMGGRANQVLKGLVRSVGYPSDYEIIVFEQAEERDVVCIEEVEEIEEENKDGYK